MSPPKRAQFCVGWGISGDRILRYIHVQGIYETVIECRIPTDDYDHNLTCSAKGLRAVDVTCI